MLKGAGRGAKQGMGAGRASGLNAAGLNKHVVRDGEVVRGGLMPENLPRTQPRTQPHQPSISWHYAAITVRMMKKILKNNGVCARTRTHTHTHTHTQAGFANAWLHAMVKLLQCSGPHTHAHRSCVQVRLHHDAGSP